MRFLLCRLRSPPSTAFTLNKHTLNPRISTSIPTRILSYSYYATRQFSVHTSKMTPPHIENDEHYPMRHKVTVVGSGNW